MLWKKKGSENVRSVEIKKAMMDGRPVAMIWSGWAVRQCLHFIILCVVIDIASNYARSVRPFDQHCGDFLPDLASAVFVEWLVALTF
jgi:hypothetical protein